MTNIFSLIAKLDSRAATVLVHAFTASNDAWEVYAALRFQRSMEAYANEYFGWFDGAAFHDWARMLGGEARHLLETNKALFESVRDMAWDYRDGVVSAA